MSQPLTARPAKTGRVTREEYPLVDGTGEVAPIVVDLLRETNSHAAYLERKRQRKRQRKKDNDDDDEFKFLQGR